MVQDIKQYQKEVRICGTNAPRMPTMACTLLQSTGRQHRWKEQFPCYRRRIRSVPEINPLYFLTVY